MSSTREYVRRAERSSHSGIVRRIVNLPLNIIGGVSRAVSHGMTIIAASRRDHQHHPQPHLQHPQESPVIPEEWVFMTRFEQHYGFSHPFFYACSFVEALRIAEQDAKPLFIYLHLPEYPYTAPFCTGTLCSDLVVQFLDANFISWGAITNRGEGPHMTIALRASTFPFCAIIMPVSGDSIIVLQQVEGPVSPAELVGILQRTLEEHGSAFRAARAAEAETRRANCQLREEQDAEYHAALQIDSEKERMEPAIEAAVHLGKQLEAENKENIQRPKRSPAAAAKQSNSKAKQKTKQNQHKDPSFTQIQIRFPNGERKEHSFLCTDKIQSIYRYIDSQVLPGIGSYRLISNFPRKVYGFEQMGMTLKDAGLHPRASLFVELA